MLQLFRKTSFSRTFFRWALTGVRLPGISEMLRGRVALQIYWVREMADGSRATWG